jgi:hypothetical protein
MWYVEAIVNYSTQEKVRYEGLTGEQSMHVHAELYDRGYPLVRSGLMR